MYSVGMRSATFLSLPAIVLCASLSWSALESDAQSAAQAPAGAAPAASVPHFPTSEELRHLKTMSAPLLSPDGRQVLFTVTEATADGGKTHFWLAAVDGKEKARQITFSAPADKRGERGGQWAPDGNAIYFLARRADHTQLFRLDMRGGKPHPTT
jgi:hypothetical protein